MEKTVYDVSQVNEYIKTLLDGSSALQDISIRGELSNYTIYPSGHHYFTLKDAEGALRCVMFKGSAMKLRFRPESGMKVVHVAGFRYFPEMVPTSCIAANFHRRESVISMLHLSS